MQQDVKNQEAHHASDASSLKQKAADQSVEQELRKKLPAEIRFDKWVYGGISYVTQALTGIILSHSIKYGKLNKPFRRLTEWITKKPAKEPSTTLVITVMVSVGNMFLLPVKWLENRKPKIVRRIQDRMNAKDPPTPEERAEQEKALTQLDHEPKQTWKSLLGGRVFGLVPVFMVDYLLGEKRNKWLQDTSAHYIQKGFGAAGLKKMAKSKTVGEYLKLGFVDSFYSAVAAGGLYIYSHFINPPEKDKIPSKAAASSEAALAAATLAAEALMERSAEPKFADKYPAKTAGGDWQGSVSRAEAETPNLTQAV